MSERSKCKVLVTFTYLIFQIHFLQILLFVVKIGKDFIASLYSNDFLSYVFDKYNLLEHSIFSIADNFLHICSK